MHASQAFRDVRGKSLDSITPIRSLADSTYVSNDCLTTARQHGATPPHNIKKNDWQFERPEAFYQKLVDFAHHWPTRFAAPTAKRNHAETVVDMIDRLSGCRLRCREKALEE